MSENTNRAIPDDEIDFKSIGQNISNAVKYPFVLFWQNKLTTLLFVLMAIAICVTLKFTIPKTYSGNFIIRPNERSERTHLRMLGDLAKLLKLKDFKALARELRIEESEAKNIVDLEFTNHAFAKALSDSSNTTTIELELRDFNQLLPLQNKLLAYLENNPYFVRIRDYQKMNIAMKTGLIDKDMLLLDSLKRMQLHSYDKLKMTEQNSVYLNDLINPTSTYTLQLERLSQKVGLLGQSMFIDSFQLVKGVVVSERHNWPPRILIMCLVLVPIFLLLCSMYLHYKQKSG